VDRIATGRFLGYPLGVEPRTDAHVLDASTAPLERELTKDDLRAYWRVFRKRWPIVAVVTAVALAVAAGWLHRQPKIYEAACQIVIEPSSPQVLQGVKDVVELGTGNYWMTKEFNETQYRIIQSTPVALRTAERLALAHDPDFRELAGNQGQAALAQIIRGRLRVEPLKETRIGAIIVSDTKPERAALIANTIADTYLEYNLDYKLDGARSANSWLSEKTFEFKKKLRDSELGLYEFRRERNLLAVGLDDKQSMTAQNLQTINAELGKVHLKRIEMEANRQLIQDALNDISDSESIPEVRSDDSVVHLRATFIQLTKEQAELAGKYGPSHPKVTAMQKELESITQAYRREIASVLSTLENRFKFILNQEKVLGRELDKANKDAVDLSKVELEYRPLARESEEELKVYNLLSAREREIDLTGLLRTNNARILERARVPHAPVRPRSLQTMMLALLIGLVGGTCVTLLVEALDNRLKSPADIEAFLGIQVLGLIPLIGDNREGAERIRERDLGIFHDPKSQAAEFCRSLRTNILFMSPDHPLRTIVVTSPNPQEGKTATSINLAITMAEAGGRVLIIDTDMRRPRLHHSFGVPNSAGISTLVMGSSTLEDVIKKTDVPNLDVLPCGPLPINPSELLHANRFATVLRDCAQRYDRVILDSPPTSAVTDPAILGNLCDGVLLVVKSGRTKRESAAMACHQLLAAQAKILGVIVNGIDFTNPEYGYHSYYREYARYGQVVS